MSTVTSDPGRSVGIPYALLATLLTALAALSAAYALIAFGRLDGVVWYRTASLAAPILVCTVSGAAAVLSWQMAARARRKLRALQRAAEDRDRALLAYARQLAAGNTEHQLPDALRKDAVGAALRDLKVELVSLSTESGERQWRAEGVALFSDLLRNARDLDAMGAQLARNLARFLGADQAAVYVWEAETGRLRLRGRYVAAADADSSEGGADGDGLLYQVWRDGKTRYLENAPAGYVRIASGLGEATAASLLLAPLRFEGQTQGVVELAAFRPFPSRVVAFMEDVSDRIGGALFNVQATARTERLLAEAQQMTADLQNREADLRAAAEQMRRAQDALQESQAQMTAMTQNVPDVIFRLEKPAGGAPAFTFISARVQDVLSIPAEKILEKYEALVFHPEDGEQFEKRLQESAETGAPLEWEGRVRDAKRRYHWARIAASATRMPDGGMVWDGILADDTDQRAQQETLRLRERAITSAAYGVIILDNRVSQGLISYVNPAFSQITGFGETEAVNQDWVILFGDDRNEDEGYRKIKYALDEGLDGRALTRMYTAGRRPLWVDLNLAPVRDERGAVTYFVALMNDVTELVEAQAQITEMNENLERQVEARTQELQGALDELKTSQQRVVMAEKMATLGTLVAGVAHEINTPLGAIKAAVENMEGYLPETLEKLPALMASLSPADLAVFNALIQDCMTPKEPMTTRDERKLRKELETALAEMGAADPRDTAQKLVVGGVRGDVARYRILLIHPQGKEIIQLAYQLAQLRGNMAVINQAADKTRKTVYALKSYTHTQSEQSLQPIDLIDSLEVILTIYHNQLKQGVEVERRFTPTPQILGFPDELGQVWTNIIHNGIQAMEYKGDLIVEVGPLDDKHAQVRITDTGPGIPKEIVEKIFNPFFTTKPKGEGTGLGLDICRKIVEKHSGTIAVDTEPGRTTFIVTLPYDAGGAAQPAPEVAAPVEAA